MTEEQAAVIAGELVERHRVDVQTGAGELAKAFVVLTTEMVELGMERYQIAQFLGGAMGGLQGVTIDAIMAATPTAPAVGPTN